MVSNLARLTESLRGDAYARPAGMRSVSEALPPEEIERARAEFEAKGQAVIKDRNGNRFLVTRRGR